MEEEPYLSVILPVYNQGNYLNETIESVLSQTYRDFEFIIVDDGSTDSSAEIIRQHALKDKRIISFFERNAGKSAATNYLVNKARGKWCVFLDGDDVMLPDRLESQVAFHKSNPEVHASSSHCYYINEKGNMFGTQRYPGLLTVKEFKRTIKREQFITCSYTGLMVSTKAFIATGGLLTRFEPCEDFEFFNRFVDKGFILLIIPKVLMKYRIHNNSVTVRKPILVRDTISYVKHCILLRRSGQPELAFDEFLVIRDSYSFWANLNRKRFNYSMIFFRSAGFSILSKKYLSFLWQITASLVLSPNYVLKKLRNQIKK